MRKKTTADHPKARGLCPRAFPAKRRASQVLTPEGLALSYAKPRDRRRRRRSSRRFRAQQLGRIVRSCHEDWDETGYPDGLAGVEIPLVARIVRCCNAFSPMTTDRSYRKALAVADAVAELHRCS